MGKMSDSAENNIFELEFRTDDPEKEHIIKLSSTIPIAYVGFASRLDEWIKLGPEKAGQASWQKKLFSRSIVRGQFLTIPVANNQMKVSPAFTMTKKNNKWYCSGGIEHEYPHEVFVNGEKLSNIPAQYLKNGDKITLADLEHFSVIFRTHEPVIQNADVIREVFANEPIKSVGPTQELLGTTLIRENEQLQVPNLDDVEKQNRNLQANQNNNQRTGIFIKIGKHDLESKTYPLFVRSSFLLNKNINDEFRMPFSELEIKDIIRECNRSVKNPRLFSSQLSQNTGFRLKDFSAYIEFIGKILFKSIFQDGNLRNLYSETANKAATRFPVYLEISDPQISQLPWEFMHDGVGYIIIDRVNIFRIVSEEIAHLSVNSDFKKQDNLRILVVPTNPPGSIALDYDSEIFAIQRLIKGTRHTIDQPINQNLDSLRQKILDFKANIVHFIGHGDQDGRMIFRDTVDPQKHIPVGLAFSGLFQDETLPNLLIFNACFTGIANTENKKLGLAAQLVSRRIPIVVSMQFSISDNAARLFSMGFYEKLLSGYPLDHAIAWGRIAMMQSDDSFEWGTPIVYLNPGLIF